MHFPSPSKERSAGQSLYFSRWQEMNPWGYYFSLPWKHEKLYHRMMSAFLTHSGASCPSWLRPSGGAAPCCDAAGGDNRRAARPFCNVHTSHGVLTWPGFPLDVFAFPKRKGSKMGRQHATQNHTIYFFNPSVLFLKDLARPKIAIDIEISWIAQSHFIAQIQLLS